MKNYDYDGIAQKSVQFDSVVIDGVEYIIPSPVAKALDSFHKRYNDTLRKYEDTVQKYENSEEFDVIAERIMSALEEGVTVRGDIRESLLKHSINEATDVDAATSENVYGYRHELHRRIVSALKGFTPDGKPYR